MFLFSFCKCSWETGRNLERQGETIQVVFGCQCFYIYLVMYIIKPSSEFSDQPENKEVLSSSPSKCIH